ncbi:MULTISPECIES: hypothetical protein [unclassified Mesorhizobium]
MAVPIPPVTPALFWLSKYVAEAAVNGKSRCGEILPLQPLARAQ